jgi:ABC-type transport system involved in cytochrome bd biosynthesis fused ATPase/permease subunit
MQRSIVTRGLPTLLLLMALAVVLMVSGNNAVGFAFGLAVAAAAGLLLLSIVAYDVARGHGNDRPGRHHRYRDGRARSF